MADNAEAKRFDLIAALSGRTYPVEKVPVFLDEALMYEYVKVSKEAEEDPANEAKQVAREKMLEAFKDFAITVTLRGVSRDILEAIEDEILEKYPMEYDVLGRPKPNRERVEEFAVRYWNVFVIKVEAPDGSVLAPPSADDLAYFRKKAPQAAIDAVEDGINTLREGPAAAYEKMVKDPAFLSRP